MARRSVLALVALLLAPAAVAYTYDAADYPAARARAIEGHTSRVVVEAAFCGTGWPEYDVASCNPPGSGPTAPAVPTPPTTVPVPRGSDVLWTNDQRFVDAPGSALAVLAVESVTVYDPGEPRAPCGGWVLATAAGIEDPRASLGSLVYVESYYVIDPNDRVWVEDRYTLGLAGPDVFVVPVLMYDIADPGPASGITCPPIGDDAPRDVWEPGDVYNAVVYLPPFAGTPAGATNGAPSHGANPSFADDGPSHLHLASDLDVYFSNVPAPWPGERSYAIVDAEGSTAPFDDRAATPPPDAGLPPVQREPVPFTVTDPTTGSRYGTLTGNGTGWGDPCEDATLEGRRATCVGPVVAGQEIAFAVLAARSAPAWVAGCFRFSDGTYQCDWREPFTGSASFVAPEWSSSMFMFVEDSEDLVYRIDGADETSSLRRVEAGGATFGLLEGADDGNHQDACWDPSREGVDSTCFAAPGNGTASFQVLTGEARDLRVCAYFQGGEDPVFVNECTFVFADRVSVQVPEYATMVGVFVAGAAPTAYRVDVG